nr:2-dehydro-3-deoxy-6-phosphogalactonate aldolase [Pseudomonadota bacterium]
ILIGAGTVVQVSDVARVGEAGAQMILAPNTDTEVIAAASQRGMAVVPGFLTATEAFSAYRAGARYLKLFPADILGANYVQAIRSVLPVDARIVPVGGITVENISEFLAAGSTAFGIGSQLYRAGRSVEDVARRAEAYIAAFKTDRH